MTGHALIAEAAQLGITLWAENESVRFRPKAAMTPQLAAKLKANRDEVLRALHCTSASSRPTAPAMRSMVGGFASTRSKLPHPSICASPVILCPRCARLPVLRELRQMTGDLCYPCWESGGEAKP